MGFAEKRKFPRLALKIQDGYFAHFLLADESALVAPVINLSAGGLNMAVAPETAQAFNAGDVLVLQQIAGGISLAFISNIQAEVRWAKSFNHPKYWFVGCRFFGMPEAVRQQLAQFVHLERMSRGQYD